MDVQADEISIYSRYDREGTRISNATNLKDANGTILIADGVWQLKGSCHASTCGTYYVENTGHIGGGYTYNCLATAVGQGAFANCESIAIGNGTYATRRQSIAIGHNTTVCAFGSFALGACVEVHSAGVGLFRVLYPCGTDNVVTELQFIGAGGLTPTIGSAAGLGYKQGADAYRYAKLSSIFNLADREEDILRGIGCSSSGSFEDTGNVLGGTAESDAAIAIGASARATNSCTFAGGYNAQACGSGSIAIGALARTEDATSVAVGNRVYIATSNSIGVGEGVNVTFPFATAVGPSASACGYGSFAYGAFAHVTNTGEGVLSVMPSYQAADPLAGTTMLKLVGAGSPVSTSRLDNGAGLGYKENQNEYRYAKLKDIFDLADRAADILALLK